MRSLARRLFLLVAVLTVASAFAGCSDAYVANRDDQQTPSVPPPSWAAGPMGIPSGTTPGSHTY